MAERGVRDVLSSAARAIFSHINSFFEKMMGVYAHSNPPVVSSLCSFEYATLIMEDFVEGGGGVKLGGNTGGTSPQQPPRLGSGLVHSVLHFKRIVFPLYVLYEWLFMSLHGQGLNLKKKKH